uniref:C2H2-type domain-containing protein n=1 Tax=Angiostrongylus cantonensis TaxID=6313 RepID=A0A158P965_ANGCA
MLRHLLTDTPDMSVPNNSGMVLPPPAMDPFQWQQYPQSGASSSVSGTSELFRYQPTPDAYHRIPPQFEHQVSLSEPIQINANYPMHYIQRQQQQKIYFTPPSTLPVAPSVAQPPPQTALPVAPLPRPSSVSPCEQASLNSPTLTSNSGSASCETPPIAGEAISTDLEGPDNERVMCMACRGVYPSRRSLTGHIGRNEKCREIIGFLGQFFVHFYDNVSYKRYEAHLTVVADVVEGFLFEQQHDLAGLMLNRIGRNYLDQVAMGANPIAPGTENAIKAGALTNGHDGLSPICPHCDRFISHYKGNIRRHINQCGKNDSPQKRPRPDKDRRRDSKRRRHEESLLPHVLHEGFDLVLGAQNSSLIGSPVMSPPLGSYLPSHEHDIQDNTTYVNNHPTDQDAYICDSCEFVTIYKGNMKRHLNTCHPAPDCKDLKEWDRKLESMRASMLGMSRAEMIDRLNAHRMNSTRGRKPRNKKHDDGAQAVVQADFSQMHYNYDMMNSSFPQL